MKLRARDNFKKWETRKDQTRELKLFQNRNKNNRDKKKRQIK